MEIDFENKNMKFVCLGTVKVGESYNGKLYTDKDCQLCGKSPRFDYDGLCMDCADEIGTSEIWEEKYDNDPLVKTIRTAAKDASLKGIA